MKWKSVLFSELSNKLGNQIVGARWKGRGYFRSYVIPANPQTTNQQANRDAMDKILKLYQANVKDTTLIKAAWDREGLPDLISGFNQFTKYGRKSKISCPATSTSGSPVTITYTCGVPLAKAALIQIKDGVVNSVADVGDLEAGDDMTVDTGILTVGTYEFYIADGQVLATGDNYPQLYQGCTKWKPDIVNGVAVEAKCVVS